MMFSKGSLWRKWDLHFHSPSSYDYENKNLSNTDIIETLVANKIRCVAITDHHAMDIERIMSLQDLGAGRITVLPGIEFCSELGGSQSVHFIGIFSEDNDIAYIWKNLSVRLKITDTDIEKRGGHNKIYTDLREAANIIHEHRGIVSIHAGRKTGSIEEISSKHLFKQAQKTDLLKEHVVDILEIGRLDDIEDYERIVFPTIQEHFPLVICSDNHDATKYQTKANCWFKADPTFNGLIQALIEPSDRIYIGEKPAKRRLVSNKKTKFISEMHIGKKKVSAIDEVWFKDIGLNFNHDLVAIIGNKGSGKSAIVEILGLLGNTQTEGSFEFLHEDRFRDPKNNLSKHFEASLTWASGTSIDKTLSDHVDPNDPEMVCCLPQGLFEDICNDIAKGPDNKFHKELMNVIFNHVPDSARYKKTSLDELIDYLTDEKIDAIEIIRSQIHEINVDIVRIEEKLSPENKLQLQGQLLAKKKDLESLEASKPQKVEKPKPTSPRIRELTQKISVYQDNIEALRQITESLKETELKHSQIIMTADKVLAKLRNLETQCRVAETDCKNDLKELGLKMSDVVTFSINTEPILEKKRAANSKLNDIKRYTDQDTPNNFATQLSGLEDQLGKLQKNLNKSDQEFQEYLKALEEYEALRKSIIGKPTELDTIKYLEKQIKDLETLPSELGKLKSNRTKLAESIYQEIRELADTHRKLHAPIQSYIDGYGVSHQDFQMSIDVSIVDTGLTDNFFHWIAKNVTGSFYGSEGGKVLDEIVNKYDFNKLEDLKAFLDDLLDHLLHDKRDDDNQPLSVIKQLKTRRDPVSLYDFIFGLEYLRPTYVLKLDDKEITMLSPGERGALLLIFYLLIDVDDTPLIIDQPEENLDNQTVFKVLVDTIKEAKNKRQIIIVTHNPNLAVVCDAEQIIHCSIDKTSGNELEYISGSIENPILNRYIVDVLEGTMPALSNRWKKYSPFRHSLN